MMRRRSVLVVIVLVAVGLVGVGVWWWAPWRPAANADPFTRKVMASVPFTLMYPTQLPTGFRIDPKSVNQPQSGVVIFNLVGPDGEKMYVSEEARPGSFDIGGYYKNFSDLSETPVGDSTIAVGKIANGRTEVGSRANSKVWVLVNTNADVPLPQLTAMLNSLTNSY